MTTISRRDVFKLSGAAGVAAAVPVAAGAQSPNLASGQHPHSNAVNQQHYHFLNEVEAAILAIMVDHLIPPDDSWPGAAEAGVVNYIDQQLAGSFGSGDRLYLQGPWQEGLPQHGYQLPYTPAQLYRNALTELTRHLGRNYAGRGFDQLGRGEQDKLLRSMESGELQLGDVPSAVFFETLLANTIEGYFADPMYGGNREMNGWRMIGFPGAYASYADLVEHHGLKFTRAPISAAESGHHLNHEH